MNLAIVRKTVRESIVVLLLACSGIVAFVVVFVWGMQNMGRELMDFLSRFPFLQQIFEMGFGIDISGEISLDIMYAVSFTHLVVLILSWAFLLSTITRVTVGEFESGTADLLLTLPVTRIGIYLSTTSVWLVGAAVVAACPLIGIWLGTAIFQADEPMRINRFIPAAVNLFALHVAVAGLTEMMSCIFSRRGPAIVVIVAVALASVTLNFLEPFLPVIENIRFLGLLHYYRPVDVVREISWPTANIIVLLAFGLLTWIIGMIVYVRKDVPVA